jgi:hypothetical protein
MQAQNTRWWIVVGPGQLSAAQQQRLSGIVQALLTQGGGLVVGDRCGGEAAVILAALDAGLGARLTVCLSHQWDQATQTLQLARQAGVRLLAPGEDPPPCATEQTLLLVSDGTALPARETLPTQGALYAANLDRDPLPAQWHPTLVGDRRLARIGVFRIERPVSP